MKLYETPTSTIKPLYQIMHDTHQVFRYNGLKYWVVAGTLLGAKRHHGIIPWDDDLDIGIKYDDRKKLLELRPTLNSCGYDIIKHWLGYKIYDMNGKKIPGEKHLFPFCDVFLFEKNGDKWQYASQSARDTWPKEWYYDNELFPLKLYEFGSFDVFGPNHTKEYFNRSYGNDWNKIAYRQYNHTTDTVIEKIKFKLTPAMRVPAKPYNQVKDRRCVKGCIDPKRKVPDPQKLVTRETKTCTRSGSCYKNFSIPMGVYVINCDVHRERMQDFEKHANNAGITYCRIKCTVGYNFTHQLICKMLAKKMIVKNLEMNPIEVSINFSHYNVWQKIVNSCYDYGLVFEDDVKLHTNFKEKINSLLRKLEESNNLDFSILHLFNGYWGYEQKRRKGELKMIINDKKNDISVFQEIEDYNAGAVGYIISKKYAKYLIKKSFPIKIPQDQLMGNAKIGKHLSLVMSYDKEGNIKPPWFDIDMGGEWGTGNTTQDQGSPTIKERWNCSSQCNI